MKLELEQKLIETYPTLFRDNTLPSSESLICYECEFGDGWYDIIDQVCKDITNLDKDGEIKFMQLKEKYGAIRIYIKSFPTKYKKKLNQIIDDAEIKSYQTCEFCGKTGVSPSGEKWITTLCDECKRKI